MVPLVFFPKKIKSLNKETTVWWQKLPWLNSSCFCSGLENHSPGTDTSDAITECFINIIPFNPRNNPRDYSITPNLQIRKQSMWRNIGKITSWSEAEQRFESHRSPSAIVSPKKDLRDQRLCESVDRSNPSLSLLNVKKINWWFLSFPVSTRIKSKGLNFGKQQIWSIWITSLKMYFFFHTWLRPHGWFSIEIM